MLIFEILISEFNVQFVTIGEGEAQYRTFFEKMAKKFPQQVGCHMRFDLALARHVFAGSDFFLMPSRFEPCGLAAMIAMRYGTIPIARKTGGLAEIIEDKKLAFFFEEYSKISFLRKIKEALKFYKKEWGKLIKNAMGKDFSWRSPTKKYLKLYQKLI
jgi:starch synthase